jgi:hypothetical protein
MKNLLIILKIIFNLYQHSELIVTLLSSSSFIVVYLCHVRTVELQEQPFLSNTRINNGTTGLWNPLLGNGSVNTLPHRRNDVTLEEYTAIT